MNLLLNIWSQWVGVSVLFPVSVCYGVYFISNIVTLSGVAVASQFQFVSRTVLQPLGHLVWGNTWWGFPDPCGGTWYRVESGAWKLFLSHFKYIHDTWSLKPVGSWRFISSIRSSMVRSYGQFYTSTRVLQNWCDTHPIEEVLTAPLHFLFPSPPPSFQSFLIFHNSFAVLQVALARPLLAQGGTGYPRTSLPVCRKRN